MGEVYRARDSKLKREVAIKVLPQSLAADADALARFEREALAVAALSHPNILAIFDFGTHEGMARDLIRFSRASESNAEETRSRQFFAGTACIRIDSALRKLAPPCVEPL
jgi:serine/threonine protein kinase